MIEVTLIVNQEIPKDQIKLIENKFGTELLPDFFDVETELKCNESLIYFCIIDETLEEFDKYLDEIKLKGFLNSRAEDKEIEED